MMKLSFGGVTAVQDTGRTRIALRLGIDPSSFVRGCGVGLMLGFYIMHASELTAIEAVCLIGIPVGLVGYLLGKSKTRC